MKNLIMPAHFSGNFLKFHYDSTKSEFVGTSTINTPMKDSIDELIKKLESNVDRKFKSSALQRLNKKTLTLQKNKKIIGSIGGNQSYGCDVRLLDSGIQ
jgi:hypothetical protein